MEWYIGPVGVLMGAASIYVPDWRARRRRRRMARDMSPLMAAAFALSLLGLTQSEVSDIIQRGHER